MNLIKRFKNFYSSKSNEPVEPKFGPEKLYKSEPSTQLHQFRNKVPRENLNDLEKSYLNKISNDEHWAEVFNKFSFSFEDGESTMVVNKYSDEWFVASYDDGEWKHRYKVDSFEGIKQLLWDKFGVYANQ